MRTVTTASRYRGLATAQVHSVNRFTVRDTVLSFNPDPATPTRRNLARPHLQGRELGRGEWDLEGAEADYQGWDWEDLQVLGVAGTGCVWGVGTQGAGWYIACLPRINAH